MRRQLTEKQKLAINFSLYVFLFYIVFALVFYFGLRTVLQNELRKSLVEEASEIVRNHLVVKDTTLQFTKDASGAFLKEELTDHGYSALFLTPNYALIRGFGLFEFYDAGDTANLTEIITKLREAGDTPFVSRVSWRGKELYTYFFPVKTDDEVLAAVVLSVPLDNINFISGNILIVLVGLGIFGFLGSLALGFYLSNKFLAPIKMLSRAVEKIDLDKLDKKLTMYGHPSDEFVVLINKFNEMLGRIEAMSGQQKDFISNASHEVKTPLTRAVTSIEHLLASREFDSEELELVKTDLFEINTLLENLLVLSKLRKGALKKGKRINVKRLLQRLKADFSKEAMEKSLAIEIDVKSNLEIVFPEDYLRVILVNLVSNSIKYSKSNTSIFLRGYDIKEGKVIEINDQGLGMTQSDKQKVFDRFYRAADSANLEGHGIGMSLVKQICDLYEVEIKLRSEKGRGTEVALVFPN